LFVFSHIFVVLKHSGCRICFLVKMALLGPVQAVFSILLKFVCFYLITIAAKARLNIVFSYSFFLLLGSEIVADFVVFSRVKCHFMMSCS